MKIEDKIVAALLETEYRYNDDGIATRSAEVEHKDLEASALASYNFHDVCDWQNFDGIDWLVQKSTVIDDLEDLDVNCWNADTGEDVKIDIDYIRARL